METPRPAALAVGEAAPEVDDHLAVATDGDTRADVGSAREVAREDLADRGEAWVAGAVDREVRRHGGQDFWPKALKVFSLSK